MRIVYENMYFNRYQICNYETITIDLNNRGTIDYEKVVKTESDEIRNGNYRLKNKV